MKKTDLLKTLDKIAPVSLAEDWDNCGMQVDLGKEEINRVLVAMEVTQSVIEKARECGADMIIAHHPLLFSYIAITSLRSGNVNENNIIDLVKSDIEVYSSHTCFDAAAEGNHDYICRLLGLERVRCFAGEIARIGRLKEPVRLEEYAALVSEKLQDPPAMIISGDPRKLIRNVAVCTGYGGEMWEQAYLEGADLFISGEFKHHEMCYMSQTDMAFIGAGHAGTEWIFVPNMAQQLKQMTLGELEIIQYKDHQIPYRTL